MKILLTGKNGQVGWELQRTLCVLGDVVALGSAELDLADADAIVRVVRAVEPDLIVNAAAYTAVDKAESEPELAMAVNGVAPGVLAEEAWRLNAPLVHYSTDYVFDGRKGMPYVETDEPCPLNVYGQSKLQGERAIQAVGGRHLILRTSWVYGTRGKNFLLTMQRLLRDRPEVKVVSDQFGAPSWSRWLAEVTQLLLAARDPGDFPKKDAIYHLTPAGETSWFDFASEIKMLTGGAAAVTAIPSADYPTPVQRPAHSVLSCKKIETDFSLFRSDWKALLEMCLAESRQ